MSKVFIGGSRRISRLDEHVRRRIDRIVEKRLPVLVGDANGADKAVQEYLRDKGHDLVEVFCSGGSCRNNVGGWPVRSVPVSGNRRGFALGLPVTTTSLCEFSACRAIRQHPVSAYGFWAGGVAEPAQTGDQRPNSRKRVVVTGSYHVDTKYGDSREVSQLDPCFEEHAVPGDLTAIVVDGIAAGSDDPEVPGSGLVPAPPVHAPAAGYPPKKDVAISIHGTFPASFAAKDVWVEGHVAVGNSEGGVNPLITLFESGGDYEEAPIEVSTSVVTIPGKWGGFSRATWVDGEDRPPVWWEAGWLPVDVDIGIGYELEPPGGGETEYRETGDLQYTSGSRFTGPPMPTSPGIINMVRAGPSVAVAGRRVTLRVVGGGFDASDAAAAKVWLIKSDDTADPNVIGPLTHGQANVIARVVEFDPALVTRYRALEVEFDLADDVELGVYDVAVKVGSIEVAEPAGDHPWKGPENSLRIPRVMNVTKIVSEVWFTDFNGATGIQMQDHFNDVDGDNVRDAGEAIGDTDIDGPEWRADGDDADSLPDKQKHALFARNDKFKVKTAFSIDGIDLAAGEAVAWATCTDSRLALGSEASPVALQKAGDKWHGIFEILTAPDAIGVLKDFTWTWHVKVNGQATCTSESTHTVLVCRQTVTGYKPYDWVAWWACEWASGETASKSIIDRIYERLDETGTTGPSADLDYTFPQTGGSNVFSLLALRQGGCGDWQYFFRDLGKVHDIVTTIHDAILAPTPPTDPTYYKFFKTFASERDVDNEAGPVGGTYVFSDHSFCWYDGTVYDPSLYNRQDGTWEDYFKGLFEKYSKDGTTWVLKADCETGKVRVKHVVDDVSVEYKIYPPW